MSLPAITAASISKSVFQLCKCADTEIQVVNAVGKHRLLLEDKNMTGIALVGLPIQFLLSNVPLHPPE